ncbi:low temperature requirement protein A [Yimella sp. NH-Cas1]|uniref:low temperature requirement protein A n=1 Tax=unclassified Yimella TaxID=2649892 RepID=UPI0031F32EE3
MSWAQTASRHAERPHPARRPGSAGGRGVLRHAATGVAVDRGRGDGSVGAGPSRDQRRRRTDGWSVTPAYFVERHGLIIIIALGEAIVGVGAGAEAALARPSVVTAVLLAVLVAAGLWWSYFGYLRGGAERRLRGTTGRERSRLARDSYSYLHLPLVAGVVFFALGVHEAVAAPGEPLPLLPALALAGGVAVFYVGDVAYRWRDHHQLATGRLMAAVGAASLIPVAVVAPALAALAGLTLVCFLHTSWELWHHPAIGPGGDS